MLKSRTEGRRRSCAEVPAQAGWIGGATLDGADRIALAQVHGLLPRHGPGERQHQRLGPVRRLLSPLLRIFLALDLDAAAGRVSVADAGQLGLSLLVSQPGNGAAFQRLP